jgi:two-component system, LytTR family, sensor kinase
MEVLPNEDILIALLVKLGIIASLAALLARSQRFKRTLFAEPRNFTEKLHLILFWGVPLSLGVAIRIFMHYESAELTLEGCFIAGLLGGNVVGLLVGCMTGTTALLLHREWLALPLATVFGLSSGLLRSLCPRKEEVWNFSPFFPINIFLSLRSRLLIKKLGWQLAFFSTCFSLDIIRFRIGENSRPGWLFYLRSDNPVVLLTIFTTTLVCIGITIKIWNNTRIEMKLAEQEVMVVKARLDALANQINPHFLFNTLNSIASLIRSNPVKARAMVIKLSHILRKLLQTHENFVPLREELEFIDNYLDIEVIRFGKDKLRIEKEIEAESLDYLIPSMILQPIIENSIKHGISPKIDGGSIWIRSARVQDRICLEVEDDGLGIAENKAPSIYSSGIGISNVLERLKVAYHSDFVFTVNSFPGQGTFTHIEIPLMEGENDNRFNRITIEEKNQ